MVVWFDVLWWWSGGGFGGCRRAGGLIMRVLQGRCGGNV